MHIVQVANFVTPTSGGQRVALNTLAKEYIAQGHSCTLVIPGAQYEVSNDGMRNCVEVPGVPVPFSGGYRAIIARQKLEKVLFELKPDVVELSDKTTLSWVPQWCRFNDIPCVLFSHERASDVVADRFATWLPVSGIFGRWAQNIQDNVSAVVCASNYAAQEYRHMSERVRIIHLGVDHKTFTSSAAIKKHDSSPVVLYAGRLSIEKRPYVAIAAIRELQIKGQRIKLLIAGDGAMRNKLEATADGLDVTFLGRISDRNQLAEIMANVDVVIAPSPYETFGLTILESLACGTPVVVSNNGAGQELIENGCGEAVESSGTQVAEALLRIMSEDRDAIRRRCITRASGYSWHLAASEMLQLFESLTSRDVVKAA